MKRSSSRILVTHVGRLQRPDDLTKAMEAHPLGQPTDANFGKKLKSAVAKVVREQADVGVDIVNDGEYGKLSWNSYINGRLGGHEIVPLSPGLEVRPSRDRIVFSEFYKELEERGTGGYSYRAPEKKVPVGMKWACTGPVTYIGQDALQRDLACLKEACEKADVEEAFIPATSPIRPNANEHYPDDDSYFEAVADAMRTEYKAIIDAGFILQIDDPYLPALWDQGADEPTLSDYRKHANHAVEILQHALRGLPEDRIRIHICWGAWHGPHATDIPLKDLVDILLKVPAQAYAIEAANPRHEHEWQVWKDVKLPDGKILIPGLVAHSTNTVEHPELVAWRIKNFASVVGRENIIAGTDCGLGYRVHPNIAWAKLKSLSEGARLASEALWSN